MSLMQTNIFAQGWVPGITGPLLGMALALHSKAFINTVAVAFWQLHSLQLDFCILMATIYNTISEKYFWMYVYVKKIGVDEIVNFKMVVTFWGVGYFMDNDLVYICSALMMGESVKRLDEGNRRPWGPIMITQHGTDMDKYTGSPVTCYITISGKIQLVSKLCINMSLGWKSSVSTFVFASCYLMCLCCLRFLLYVPSCCGLCARHE